LIRSRLETKSARRGESSGSLHFRNIQLSQLGHVGRGRVDRVFFTSSVDSEAEETELFAAERKSQN
jgi:hypothetical protein